jgi:hypothetical protein
MRDETMTRTSAGSASNAPAVFACDRPGRLQRFPAARVGPHGETHQHVAQAAVEARESAQARREIVEASHPGTEAGGENARGEGRPALSQSRGQHGGGAPIQRTVEKENIEKQSAESKKEEQQNKDSNEITEAESKAVWTERRQKENGMSGPRPANEPVARPTAFLRARQGVLPITETSSLSVKLTGHRRLTRGAAQRGIARPALTLPSSPH